MPWLLRSECIRSIEFSTKVQHTNLFSIQKHFQSDLQIIFSLLFLVKVPTNFTHIIQDYITSILPIMQWSKPEECSKVNASYRGYPAKRALPAMLTHGR